MRDSMKKVHLTVNEPINYEYWPRPYCSEKSQPGRFDGTDSIARVTCKKCQKKIKREIKEWKP